MQQQTAYAAPVNRVSAGALAQLRTTTLDLETRLIAQLHKRNGFADEALVRSFVHSLQSDLEARIEELQRWDGKNGLAVRGSKASDLTLANATSWAVWSEQRTLLPQSTNMFEGKRPVAQETLADVADDDPRWADLLEKIHADVFFISINWGSAKRGLPITPRSYRFDTDFLNFHENVPHRNTRDALLNRFERFIAPFTDEQGTEPFCASHLSGLFAIEGVAMG
ncbi:MAG: hypothetical protein GX814_06210 [Microbacteriaceae bacterium]|nr:hypothetical protein [Microbacteriaceae bacterium]